MATSIGSVNIVREPLRKDNYENWRACMKNYLLGQDLWKIVESESKLPKAWRLKKSWRMKNAAALHAIQISCSPELLAEIREETSAKGAWNTLANLCKSSTAAAPESKRQSAMVGHAEHTTHSIALLKAMWRGDLNTLRCLLTEHPDLINANIVRNSEGLSFHFAIILGNLETVEEFVSKMSTEEDLIQQTNTWRYTALHIAAFYKGKTKIAELLIRKKKELLTIPDFRNEIPLVSACRHGNRDMIQYLYSIIAPEFLLSSQNQHHANLTLIYCIGNQHFDVALDLLRRCPQLATYDARPDPNAVVELSRLTSAFPSTSGLSFWQRCIYSCLKVKKPEASIDDIRIYTQEQDQKATKCFFLKGKLFGLWSCVWTFFGIKQIYDLKLNHSYAHELLVLISEAVVGLDASQIHENVRWAIFNAARQGMIEFITQIIKANTDLLWIFDDYGRSIFQSAVENRQEKTYSLVYGMDFMKTEFSTFCDRGGNNILHLAGQLSESGYSRLAQISGSALQMQRELQWFKEVQSIISSTSLKRHVNGRGKTPDELFNESHADLITKGEEWMKDIAKSSIIVGTLIITIMFAALYTVPGGNNQTTGIPVLLTKKAFKVFVISDAISLFASSTSVLMSVGILTSRYTAKDFLKSLPTKMIIALSSLFISIATMMMAFCSTVIIMLKGQLAVVIPICLLAGIPVSLFIWLQFPLLVNMIISTYGPGIFDRKMKNWLI